MREIFLILITLFASKGFSLEFGESIQRRILHQPLFPDNSTPPPGLELPPPPPVTPSPPPPDPNQPFFPEVPTAGQDQPNQSPSTTTPSSSANGSSIPIPAATQPAKPAKKVAIAISVGIVTLGMLSALAFFLYRHRASKHSTESQKLVGSQQRRNQEESGVPPSSFLYIGTVVEPSGRSVSETNGANGSPYHKLNSVKRSSDRYRPSPELQPLPQLTKPPSPLQRPPRNVDSPVAGSSSDEESHDTAFYTPQCSSISTDEYYTPATRQGNLYSNGNGGNYNVPHSKRTSPRSRIMAASPEMKPVIMPSIKQNQTPRMVVEESPKADAYPPKKPKFSAPPPPPNMELLRSLNSTPPQRYRPPVPPPPPPPPPPPMQRKVGGSSEASVATTPVLVKTKSWSSSPKSSSSSGQSTKSVVEEGDRSAGGGSENTAGDSLDGTKPKLKALHWDKVRATSDRATVWDQLKSSSFQ